MRVLDDGMSTRLYERICDRLGLCYDVSGMFEAYEDDGVLDVAAGAAARAGPPGDQGDPRPPPRPRRRRARPRTSSSKARDRHLWSVEAMLDDPDAVAGFYGLAALAGIARTPMARHEELARVDPRARCAPPPSWSSAPSASASSPWACSARPRSGASRSLIQRGA